MTIDLPTLSLVLVSAAVDAINPCGMGVLILMISVVLGNKGSIRKLLRLGGLYILAIYLTYLIAGLGLIYFLTKIPLFVTEYLALIIGSVMVLAGIVEIKDFFWYGQGFSLQIPHYFSQKINNYAKNLSTSGVIILGVFVAAVELPCTGAPYFAIITLLSINFNFQAFLLLLIYNLIFVLPLLVILLLVVAGTKITTIQSWKQANKALMRFAIGFLLIALGWLLILIANGTINFG